MSSVSSVCARVPHGFAGHGEAVSRELLCRSCYHNEQQSGTVFVQVEAPAVRAHINLPGEGVHV